MFCMKSLLLGIVVLFGGVSELIGLGMLNVFSWV